jgi:hypothetical protein
MGGVNVQTHVFLTSAIIWCECSASHPDRFIPREIAPRYPLHKRPGGPQSQSGWHGVTKILDPHRDSNYDPWSTTPLPVAILTALSQLQCSWLRHPKMGTVYSSKMSVINYQTIWHHIPEESNVQSPPWRFQISQSTFSTWQDQRIHFWSESIQETGYVNIQWQDDSENDSQQSLPFTCDSPRVMKCSYLLNYKNLPATLECHHKPKRFPNIYSQCLQKFCLFWTNHERKKILHIQN